MSQRYSVPRPERDRTRRVSVNIGGLSPAETLVIDIAATGTLSITGAAQLNATGALLSAGSLAITGSADLDAVGELVAAGSLTVNGAAQLNAVGNLVAAGALSINGLADLSSASDIDIAAVGSLSITGAANLSAVGELAASGSVVITGEAELTSEVDVDEEEVVTGGNWPLWSRIERIRRYDDDDEDEEEDERERLANRLERVLIEEGTLTQEDADLLRLKGLASEYVESLPNRTLRAIEYANRARSRQALDLALREFKKVREEEELALLMVLALD